MLLASTSDLKKIYTLANDKLSVDICPEDGMNIYALNYKGDSIIRVDEQRYATKANYGTPILYPSPNIVAGNLYQLGQDLWCEGVTHGFVSHKPFCVTKFYEQDNCSALQAVLEFDSSKEWFSLFPFTSTLSVEIKLTSDSLIYEYSVFNQDEKPLPYGFAIHPFFYCNGQNVAIQTSAQKVMETDNMRIPTGKLLDIDSTPIDLNKPKLVKDLNLNHVYTKLNPEIMARLQYQDYSLNISASDDFTHLVVFTPNDEYFCIEPQTCSTDAHNLYYRGFTQESGLIWLMPGQTKKGHIEISFK